MIRIVVIVEVASFGVSILGGISSNGNGISAYPLLLYNIISYSAVRTKFCRRAKRSAHGKEANK